jgi:hypothetical protein
MYRSRLLVLVTCLLVAGFTGGVARAETVNCAAITVAPITISTHGIYCLTHNLNVSLASGIAITIAANDVVLDLNGWALVNGGQRSTTASGIRVAGVRRVSIRNGTVRGFFAGVEILGVGPSSGPAVTGHVVEDLRVIGSRFSGISVTIGNGDVVRNNIVLNTGGTDTSGAFGILVNQRTRVLNNDVGVVRATVSAYGISAGNGSTVAGNRVTDVAQGIQCGTSGDPTKLRDNVVINASDYDYDFAGLCVDAGRNS